MSEARATLERLCGLCGIATGYHDIFGHWREAPEASLVALLAELDVDAGSPERAQSAEAALRAAATEEVLPPVIRVAAGRTPWQVRARIASPATGPRLAWRLVLEDGTRH